MEKITDQKHTKYTFIYGVASMFERAGYYGVRAVLVLYLTSSLLSEGGLEMSRGDALGLYGTMALAIAFTTIIGALLGDLVLKSKKAIILGGILQAIGAFILCIHSVNAVYISVGLIALGAGLYKPNMIAYFGKFYLNKTKLLDGAYTIYYGFINLGAFAGVLALGYIGEVYSWKISFIIAGFFFLIAMLIPLFSKEETIVNPTVKSFSVNRSVILILVTLIVLGVFWMFSDLTYVAKFDIRMSLAELVNFENPHIVFQQIESFPVIVFSLIFAVIWSWYYNHQFVKMLIGFFFGFLSFGVLFLIPEVVTATHFWIFCLSLFFLSIAEIHLAPVLNSTIVKYGNPKYLAILIAVSALFTRMFAGITKLFPDELYDNSAVALKIGAIGILLVIVLLIVGILFGKKYLKE
ncbi:MFS transporter [Kordia sp.]|uniref:POT-type proton-dependent oligopeptide transporter n=1 Tax=Kordia sp. TaxID=1965332 RepID=UPI003D2AAFDE